MFQLFNFVTNSIIHNCSQRSVAFLEVPLQIGIEVLSVNLVEIFNFLINKAFRICTLPMQLAVFSPNFDECFLCIIQNILKFLRSEVCWPVHIRIIGLSSILRIAFLVEVDTVEEG